MTSSELDALNVMLHWFGGHMGGFDCWIASIPTRLMRDLQEKGMVRKRLLGWEITSKGRQALKDHNITKFSDTRGGW